MSGSEHAADRTPPPAAHWPDAQLLSAAADGDGRAWQLLVDRHVQDVWTAACTSGASPGAAAGASAVAWLRLSQRLGQAEPTEGLSVRSWLARTALGVARSAARAAAAAPSREPGRTEQSRSARVLQTSAAALERAHELARRLDFAQRQSERAISRAGQLLTALSLERSLPDLHATPDLGPLTDQWGVTLCALLVGDEVRLLQGIQWSDVRAAEKCPACTGFDVGVGAGR